MSLKIIISVGLGGFAGTILRWLLGVWIARLVPAGFPYGTLSINLLGALLIGGLYGYFEKYQILFSDWRTVLTVGFCGGFTTFSAFTIENLVLLREGQIQIAFLYIFSSLLLGLAMTYAGYLFARA